MVLELIVRDCGRSDKPRCRWPNQLPV